ncbi:GNAT family N-acetyltransferase [Rhizobium oryzicola]|uniref:GNAT family N-acetyltransferase n=1 Tax=Rhizobium oryzicola TaxID=1232668 RepID=A0ABT8SVS1_9HYPH|nr:GNAT family N-acetyltransferase [Rhizobium oryzicola]MDO1582525.1 GNAT family N-acetyltransferase [Rhizobium oryzicola]
MDVTHTARDELVIRPIEPTDSIEDLTTLLHAAYGRLARMGLKYMATDQSVDVTRERAGQGTCLLAFQGSRLCGTILFRNAAQTRGCPWYDRKDVASLAQFAVDPSLQAKGIGLRLMREVEQLARASGAAELALDTAEPATHLVNWYGRLGFRFIEHTQWSHTNYRSVILSKALW